MGETENLTAEAITRALQEAIDAMHHAEREIQMLNSRIRQLEAERDQWQRQAVNNG